MERIAGELSDVLVAKDVVEPEDRDFYRYAIESLLIIEMYGLNLNDICPTLERFKLRRHKEKSYEKK